jgi:hypothetical protein
MTDGDSLLIGTTAAGLASGTATFEAIGDSALTGSDTLMASLSLNPSLVPALDLTVGSGTFQVIAPTAATLSSPTPSTTLTNTSVTFTWAGGVGVEYYQLVVGTTGVGSSNLYNSGPTLGTSETVTVPATGAPLYVRLRQLLSGVWQWTDYTYTQSGAPIAAAITSPAAGSTLTSGSVTFSWPGSNVAQLYQILIGTTGVNSGNVFNSGLTTQTSATVTVPTTGQTLYVLFRQNINGAWQSTQYTYTESGAPIAATITNPASGSTLTGGSATFEWPGSNVAQNYQLLVGTNGVNSSDVFNSGLTTQTSATVTVPTAGQTLYVLLRQYISGAWQSTQYTYTESGSPIPAVISSPASGSTLSSGSVNFQWPGSNVAQQYQLMAGTTGVGSSNVYSSGLITQTSQTVTVPTNGQTLYVRLRQYFGGTWQSNDYTYILSGTSIPATISSPGSGSTLTSASVTFNWPGSNVAQQYQLLVGTTGVNSSNVYNSGLTTQTSATVTVPTAGQELYVLLRQNISGVWQSTQYTYTESGAPIPAAITSPTPGTTLTGASVTFQWPGSNVAQEYQLLVGTTGVASSNVFNSGLISATSATVTVPTTGAKVYVRLRQDINGTWLTTDYTYTEQ